jgi:hypothetical protein
LKISANITFTDFLIFSKEKTDEIGCIGYGKPSYFNYENSLLAIKYNGNGVGVNIICFISGNTFLRFKGSGFRVLGSGFRVHGIKHGAWGSKSK